MREEKYEKVPSIRDENRISTIHTLCTQPYWSLKIAPIYRMSLSQMTNQSVVNNADTKQTSKKRYGFVFYKR